MFDLLFIILFFWLNLDLVQASNLIWCFILPLLNFQQLAMNTKLKTLWLILIQDLYSTFIMKIHGQVFIAFRILPYFRLLSLDNSAFWVIECKEEGKSDQEHIKLEKFNKRYFKWRFIDKLNKYNISKRASIITAKTQN